MNFRFLKRIVAQNINHRFAAILAFGCGVLVWWSWQTHNEPVPSSFLVHLPHEHQPSRSKPVDENEECFIEGSHDGIELNNARIRGMKFRGSDLSRAHIINSEFINANLSGTSFRNAAIFYSNFTNANFRRADLSNAGFHGSDLTGANLISAKMTRANLSYSDLSEAKLTKADLTDANLSDARLETARGLTYEQLEKAVINEFTTLPTGFGKDRKKLLLQSQERIAQLRQEMSKKDFANYYLEYNSYLNEIGQH